MNKTKILYLYENSFNSLISKCSNHITPVYTGYANDTNQNHIHLWINKTNQRHIDMAQGIIRFNYILDTEQPCIVVISEITPITFGCYYAAYCMRYPTIYIFNHNDNSRENNKEKIFIIASASFKISESEFIENIDKISQGKNFNRNRTDLVFKEE